MAFVCFSSGPVCACEPSIKDRVRLKGIAPGKWGGRKLSFGVLYINGMTSLKERRAPFCRSGWNKLLVSCPENLQCVEQCSGTEKRRCPVLKIWRGAFVWPKVQSESYVYSICDIWMNRHNCAIWIHINAETINSGFWSCHLGQRWKYFL